MNTAFEWLFPDRLPVRTENLNAEPLVGLRGSTDVRFVSKAIIHGPIRSHLDTPNGNQRSISPNTMSRELSIAGTSASMCPRVRNPLPPSVGMTARGFCICMAGNLRNRPVDPNSMTNQLTTLTGMSGELDRVRTIECSRYCPN